MKNEIAKIEFTNVSMIAMFFRLFCAGFTHAPILFGTMAGLYAALIAFKSTKLIALIIKSKFSLQ